MYGEGSLSDQTCQKWFVKFHAGNFHWLMPHSQVDHWSWDINWTETLIENNQHYTTQKIDDILKYPNQALKIICINLVNHFDVWVPHKWKKSFLTIFPHAVLYWNITKHPVFKTNFDGQWKVDTVQKYGVEENVGQVKWTITNHTKGQSSSKEGVVVYMVELERSPLLWAPSRKPND